MIPEWILTSESPAEEGYTWKKMKYEDFLEVDEVLKSVLHAGRDTMLTLDAEGMRTVTEVVEKSVGEIEKLKDYKATPVQNKKTRWVRLALQDLNMMEYLYEEMDDFHMERTGEFGPMRTLNNQGRIAEGNFKDILSSTLALADPHWKLLQKAQDRIEKEHGVMFKIEGLPVHPVLKLEGKYDWTVDQMVAFLLNTGNEHNLAVIKNAYNYETPQINKIASFFTTKELEAIQGIWDVTNVLFDPLDKTHFRMYNRHLPKVEAEQVVLQGADGEITLPGGYYPLAFDRSLSDIAEDQQEKMNTP